MSERRTGRSPISFDRTAVVIFACDRPRYLRRCLRSVLPRAAEAGLPVVVSQDGDHRGVTRVIAKHRGRIAHLRHEVEIPDAPRPDEGYRRIASHYRWALDRMFQEDRQAVIILEDDMEIAPDVFDYMRAGARLLTEDPSIWTISAWNDHGQAPLVSDPEAMHRTDVSPGLGWMLTRDLWSELGPRWPDAHWDHWMRSEDQRKGRVSIRPEVSRSYTFGRRGVSRGLYFRSHLERIRLNDAPIDFSRRDLSYLHKQRYDRWLCDAITAAPEVLMDAVETTGWPHPCRIRYDGLDEYRALARRFGLMEDPCEGLPRTSYPGVLVFRWRQRPVFLVPTGYLARARP